MASTKFDEDCEAYRRRGFEMSLDDKMPVGTRVAYCDSSHTLPGMIELIEIGDAQELRWTRMYAEAAAWDGTDPIRRLG